MASNGMWREISLDWLVVTIALVVLRPVIRSSLKFDNIRRIKASVFSRKTGVNKSHVSSYHLVHRRVKHVFGMGDFFKQLVRY